MKLSRKMVDDFFTGDRKILAKKATRNCKKKVLVFQMSILFFIHSNPILTICHIPNFLCVKLEIMPERTPPSRGRQQIGDKGKNGGKNDRKKRVVSIIFVHTVAYFHYNPVKMHVNTKSLKAQIKKIWIQMITITKFWDSKQIIFWEIKLFPSITQELPK